MGRFSSFELGLFVDGCNFECSDAFRFTSPHSRDVQVQTNEEYVRSWLIKASYAVACRPTFLKTKQNKTNFGRNVRVFGIIPLMFCRPGSGDSWLHQSLASGLVYI